MTPPNPPHRLSTASLSVRIASLFSFFSFAIFLRLDQTNFMRQPFDFTAQVWAGPIRNPQITLTPITAAQTTIPYSYQVVASDPQGNPLTYSLSAAPTGMTVSGTGLVSWTPNSVGTFPVGITVNNGHGGNASQSYSIAVTPLTVPNVVGLGQPAATKALLSASLKVGTVTYQTEIRG
jgi:Putative Ig domain